MTKKKDEPIKKYQRVKNPDGTISLKQEEYEGTGGGRVGREYYQMWKPKFRLRFRFRSFPLVILYIVISVLLIFTVVGVFFWLPLWANYLVNNVEIEELEVHKT